MAAFGFTQRIKLHVVAARVVLKLFMDAMKFAATVLLPRAL